MEESSSEIRTIDFMGLGLGASVVPVLGFRPIDTSASSHVEVVPPSLKSVMPEFVVHPNAGRMPKTGHSTINSSFAPKDIAIAVAKWGESPKKYVREMGLAGLLHVDHFTHFSRNHSLFLLQCVDTFRKRLVLSANSYANITERSMSAILGTREGGQVEIKRVREGPTSKEIFMVRRILELDLNHQEVKIVDLLKVLCEVHPEQFTKARIIRLKLAFAMLVLAVFYSPREKRGYVPKDAYMLAYWPENLDKLNWTEYGVAELLDGAARAQLYVKDNTRAGFTIFGCHYYLQVLYFDSVDAGDQMVDPTVFPRICAYDAAKLIALVERDTMNCPSMRIFGLMRPGVKDQLATLGRHKRKANGAKLRTVLNEQPCAVNLSMIEEVVQQQPDNVATSSLASRIVPDDFGRSCGPDDMTNRRGGLKMMMTGMETAEDIQKLVRQAEVWLQNAIASMELNSKLSDDKFFEEVKRRTTMFDESINTLVENHRELQKTTKLLTLQYLHNHLVEHGVGKHMPGLEKHLSMINMLLAGGINAGAGEGSNTGVVPLTSEVLDGLFGSNSALTGATWSGVEHSMRAQQATIVINPVPIRSAPVNMPRDHVAAVHDPCGAASIRRSNGSVFKNFEGAGVEHVEQSGSRGGTNGIASPKRQKLDIEPESGGKELIVYTATRCRQARIEPNYLIQERYMYLDLPPAENPFQYDKRINFPSRTKARKLFENCLFSHSSITKKLWFVHKVPTLLKISGSELVDYFQEFGKFTGKTYECIRRMLDEIEHGWYGIEERRRWRRIMKKEWVELVLEGGDYLKNPKMREMFAGGQQDYALDTCQLIWAMHETEEGYCIMYAFDMDLEILHVFDPKRTCAGIEILESIHKETCDALLTGLLKCVDAFFEGWDQDRSNWQFKFHAYVNSPCRTEDTSVYGVHYILSFDGMHVHGHIDKETMDHLRKKLMYLVVKMESNLGFLYPNSDDE